LRVALAQLNGPDAPIEQMVAAYERLLPKLRADAAFVEMPFAGAGDLLAELAAMPDVTLAIATGHVSHAIAPALETLDWRKHFATVQCADMAPSKPHPGMLLQAAAATGIAPDKAIMIGDTAFDIEMARAANFDAIGVGWGYHRPDGLRAAGARQVVADMAELQACILEMLGRC
jgi:phosphoglycolate phosphatase